MNIDCNNKVSKAGPVWFPPVYLRPDSRPETGDEDKIDGTITLECAAAAAALVSSGHCPSSLLSPCSCLNYLKSNFPRTVSDEAGNYFVYIFITFALFRE